ncbi:DNA-3-methyladenine glycosylase [soil metagenome]
MNKFKPVPRSFFKKDTFTIAKELLGMKLEKKTRDGILSGIIVETEAYHGDHDPACHAYGRVTERNKILFGPPGNVYVYFIYGNYFCFNITTEKKGVGAAVLIRGVMPVEGIEIMQSLRGEKVKRHDLTNGPSKFCMAFDIDKSINGDSIYDSDIKLLIPVKKEEHETAISKRIGLTIGTEFEYRYFIKGNPYVTKHKFNKI